jgi:hypothetical protein
MTNTEKSIRNTVKGLAKVAYPDYKGRKFSLAIKQKYYPSNYWDGGSRNYMVAVDFQTGRIVEPSEKSTIPFEPISGKAFDIPPGVGILEHTFYCGKDLGVCLYVSQPFAIEENKNKLIGE